MAQEAVEGASRPYPLDIRGELSPNLSRGLWLIKWLLAIPHYVVLIVLGLVSFVLWIIAFWAVLITARYPRGIFNFNVGVLRWGWRVSFYAIAPLGTDRYPPFSLAADDDYPADLHVQYPERLSRLKVLFKWWLLAIPHYVILVFFGGSPQLQDFVTQALESGAADLSETAIAALPVSIIVGIGLDGVLATIAGVVLLFSGRYPQDIFDLLMGISRWGLRVMGYAGLMYDEYPPFRLRS